MKFFLWESEITLVCGILTACVMQLFYWGPLVKWSKDTTYMKTSCDQCAFSVTRSGGRKRATKVTNIGQITRICLFWGLGREMVNVHIFKNSPFFKMTQQIVVRGPCSPYVFFHEKFSSNGGSWEGVSYQIRSVPLSQAHSHSGKE